jgi:hypothetical protein
MGAEGRLALETFDRLVAERHAGWTGGAGRA